MVNAIEIRNLTISYSNGKIIDNIDLFLEKGKVYGLVGGNGSGKSTLVNCILGLLPYKRGEIAIFGKQIYFNKTRKYVFSVCSAVLQDVSLPKRLTVKECLRLFAILGKGNLEKVEEVIHLLQLDEQEEVAYDKLSFGQKQRVVIGTALLQNFEILFLDEPTNGLDIETRYALFSIMSSLRQEGKTIVFISHREEEISEICDDIIFIENKKVKVRKGSLS
ncbi:ABC transporter ATP-binding protein [Streptococcus oralis]|uniref:ABC transporter ATP-binding protein n=1 Tax=Streptococcus oralis TaxID=1303 RepID=A0A7T4M035_STROR|nr:ABC transporter ATP-binding protein [Streptococcus oralis]QQC35124.1 ABC transporter ATP-binding protein [Streptococcus oralis]